MKKKISRVVIFGFWIYFCNAIEPGKQVNFWLKIYRYTNTWDEILFFADAIPIPFFPGSRIWFSLPAFRKYPPAAYLH